MSRDLVFGVTAATGALGRLAVEALLDRGVPAGTIVAGARNPQRAADLAARGVMIREADYSRPETLSAAFAGVDRLLIVSSNSEPRVEQHGNAIAAAQAAGVGLVAYTSVLNADTTTMMLAADHQATERILRSSGVPFVLLRNGWYTENYTGDLQDVLEHGMVGSAATGRAGLAARADYAAAAAVVLIGEGHAGRAYELAGDETPTLAELAAVIASATGADVRYHDLPVEEYAAILAAAGLPAPMATVYADSSAAIARGELLNFSSDLARLLGRPTTTIADTVRAAVAAHRTTPSAVGPPR